MTPVPLNIFPPHLLLFHTKECIDSMWDKNYRHWLLFSSSSGLRSCWPSPEPCCAFMSVSCKCNSTFSFHCKTIFYAIRSAHYFCATYLLFALKSATFFKSKLTWFSVSLLMRKPFAKVEESKSKSWFGSFLFTIVSIVGWRFYDFAESFQSFKWRSNWSLFCLKIYCIF